MQRVIVEGKNHNFKTIGRAKYITYLISYFHKQRDLQKLESAFFILFETKKNEYFKISINTADRKGRFKHDMHNEHGKSCNNNVYKKIIKNARYKG